MKGGKAKLKRRERGEQLVSRGKERLEKRGEGGMRSSREAEWEVRRGKEGGVSMRGRVKCGLKGNGSRTGRETNRE